jgi:hypothetical protein
MEDIDRLLRTGTATDKAIGPVAGVTGGGARLQFTDGATGARGAIRELR